MKRLLILGGTGEATELADCLSPFSDLEVIISLTGRTQHPVSPSGRIYVGGFGGTTKLAIYLKEHQIDPLLDAIHNFRGALDCRRSKCCSPVSEHLIHQIGTLIPPDVGSQN
jgi:precorrin-6A/cobalt-precorrin-6A reductase